MIALPGRRALVTGGTSGIGRAVALGLAKAGAHVLACGLEAKRDEALAAAGIEAVALDVADEAAVSAFARQLDALDILVNAAGMIRRAAEHDPAVFDAVVDVNLGGTMRVSAGMRARLAASPFGGAVVNVASMLSFFGGGQAPGYSASKGGVAQLTKSLAIAWAPERIRVNAVAPGWIATPLTLALQADPARSAAILARTPMGRWGEPEDLVGPVLFLCSPLAGFVTGAILTVDGGYAVA